MDKNEVNVPKIRFPGFTDPWEQRKLKQLASFAKGQGYSKNDLTDAGTPIILYGRLYTKYQSVISEVDTFVIPKNGSVYSTGKEVIVPASGETAEDIARASAIAISGFLLGGDLNIIYPNKDISTVFLALSISNGKQQKELSKKAQGKSVVHLHNSDLENVTISYPCIEEQERIGSVFANVDNLITLHQRKLNHLQDKKKGLLQKMFPQNGESFPELRFPGFTDPWEQRKFMEVFAERRDKTVVENEDILLSCAINGMFLNSELFGHFRGSSTIGYLKVKKNDLILSAQNLHLGNANVNLRFEHGIISPAYKVFEFIDSDPNFIQSWVKKDATKNFFLAATTEGASQCRKNIEWKTLYNQKMLLPSRKEQEVIGAFFNNIDNFITLHQRKLEHLQQQKKGLLQQMFI
ncbi:restriction endonuclease subunit S [Clostridium sp. MB40-C1]|uniref:restriction endonuclease subunit S n=1 Tax=Clostridium sp. MB40-C1 TaxID=3070996 RepID=UPI0027DF4EE1|nr:restriction endonuclease subunit S [Clostridium sp. MB40-C1]WMJ81449.1 restriction endonuclease subunit S [Clostridium sp. MB40-C1]